ncbi:MAG TPA: hypothetical protein VNA20_01730 [Frankiaceae bacterium]|nr:hypothetical protein [Frankiaceae bacterium]
MADWDGLRRGLESSVSPPPLAALRERRRQRQQRRTIAVTCALAMVGTASGMALLGRPTARDGDAPPLAARPTARNTIVSGDRQPPLGDHESHVVTDVDFVSATTGWAIGVRCEGTVCDVATFRTNDGGRTWGGAVDLALRVPRASFHEEDATGGAVRSLRMVDERRGYAFNPDLYWSDDGGETWQRVPQPSKVTSVSVTGESVWVTQRGCPRDVDCDLAVRTGTVGGELRELDVPETNAALAIVRRGAADDGYLLTWDGPEQPSAAFHATRDRGTTWARRAHPCPDATAAALSAWDRVSLWAVCTTPAGRSSYQSTDGGATWRPVGTAPAAGEVTDLVARSGTEAFLTLQNPGRLLVTRDGGRTWSAATGTGRAYGYANLDVVSDTHAWAMGDEGQLWRTTDGERWERLALPPKAPLAAPPKPPAAAPSDTDVEFTGLHFTDRRTGWALGRRCVGGRCRAVLRRTTDGGATWQVANAPAGSWRADDEAMPPHRVSSVAFADERNGWLFGQNVFATHDGGRTWREVRSDYVYDVVPRGDVWWTVSYEGCASNPCGASVARGATGEDRARDVSSGYRTGHLRGWFDAPTARHAYFVDASYDDPDGIFSPVVVGTDDGGSTWKTHAAPCPDAYRRGLSSYAPDGLWVLCSGNTDGRQEVATSTDGGATWRTHRLPARGEEAGELRALSPTDAWRTGARSGLLVTRDGGRTWRAAPDIRTRVFALTFLDATHGWVLDRDGHVWRTTDGATWARLGRP